MAIALAAVMPDQKFLWTVKVSFVAKGRSRGFERTFIVGSISNDAGFVARKVERFLHDKSKRELYVKAIHRYHADFICRDVWGL